MKKVLTGILTVGLLTGLAVPAAADWVDTVSYRSVNIVVDGDRIHPKDANGAPVEPFLYRDTTYLPVRSVANALGLEVGWEDGTVILTGSGAGKAAVGTPLRSNRDREVYMGGNDVTVTLDGKVLELKDANGNAISPILVDGVTYLPVRAIADALKVRVEWDSSDNTVYLGKRVLWLPTEQVMDVNGSIDKTTYTYDSRGNVLTQVYTYNGNNGISFAPETTTFTYDGQDRLLKKTVKSNDPEYPADHETTYAYDKRGNLIKETHTDHLDPSSDYTVVYSHDSRGNVLLRDESHADGAGNTVTYTYDAAGRLLTEQGKDKLETGGSDYSYKYTYDALGNLLTSETVRVYAGVTERSRYAYTYDAAGNVLSEAYSHTDGDGNTLNSSTLYSYDHRGNKVTETYVHPDGSQVQYTHTYDAYNHIVSSTNGQPDSVVRYTYTYTNGGDILSKTAVYADGYTETETFTYDAHGNLLTKQTAEGKHFTNQYICVEQ